MRDGGPDEGRLSTGVGQAPSGEKKPKGGTRPPRGPHKMTPDKVNQAIGMRTAGMPTAKIAQAMEVTPVTVKHALEKVPNLQEQIDIYRQNLRLKTIKHIHDKHELLWNRIGEEIPTGSAKDVDALYRAAHASEKMAAAVTGESVKVEVTGEAPQVEIKNLLMQLGLDGLKALG